MKNKTKKLFVKGAFLYTLSSELMEEEFIERAGGIDQLNPFQKFRFVTLILDDSCNPRLVGHNNGKTIALSLTGYKQFQTMEWK